jgi:hypothetical protein
VPEWRAGGLAPGARPGVVRIGAAPVLPPPPKGDRIRRRDVLKAGVAGGAGLWRGSSCVRPEHQPRGGRESAALPPPPHPSPFPHPTTSRRIGHAIERPRRRMSGGQGFEPRQPGPEAERPEAPVTDLGGLLRVFLNHLRAGWGGCGPFRAQSVKFVSSNPPPTATTRDETQTGYTAVGIGVEVV